MDDDQLIGIALTGRASGQNAKDHNGLKKNRAAMSMPKLYHPTVHLLGGNGSPYV